MINNITLTFNRQLGFKPIFRLKRGDTYTFKIINIPEKNGVDYTYQIKIRQFFNLTAGRPETGLDVGYPASFGLVTGNSHDFEFWMDPSLFEQGREYSFAFEIQNGQDEIIEGVQTVFTAIGHSVVNTGQNLPVLIPPALTLSGETISSNNRVVDEVSLGSVGAVNSVNGKTGVVVLDKTDIGLENVENVDQTNPQNIVQSNDFRFVTDSEKNTWNNKQDLLVSGTNIRTINNTPVLGSGNLNIVITSVPTPVNPTSPANKDYVDNPFSWTPSNYGLQSWSFDPAAISNATSPAIGTLHLVKLRIPRPTTISNLVINIAAASSGVANCFLALYQNNVLLAQSADQSLDWQIAGNKVIPITPQAVAAGTVDVGFWVGTVIGGNVTISRGGNQNGQNGQLVGNDLRWSTANTGLSTTAPATLATRNMTNLTYWAAVS